MQAIELSAEIDQNQQNHLQLPKSVSAHKAKVIVIYEDQAKPASKPLKLGLFKGQTQISDDFNTPLPDSFWLEGKL